ncbi:ribosomal protein S2, flavodoxin-like domain-containing protein [Mortierella sp. GBAus27b]|nr:37S ribosomal protein, mitochondrial [Mortierella sp. GBA43]KAI8363075.1 ribosomal protein S2, flavodoxin-like domain-containing protein [Mortierella sp. GBAus27b]
MAHTLLRSSFRAVRQVMASGPRATLRVNQTQGPRTWARATQGALYSTGKESGPDDGDDDLLDAMMANIEHDYVVATPADQAAATPKLSYLSSTSIPSEASTTPATSAAPQSTSTTSDANVTPEVGGGADPEVAFVPRPVDIQRRLEALLPEFMSYGGQLAPKPKSTVGRNPTSNSLSISQMLAAGLHLGHSTTLWNAASMPFIFGVREGISIINLEHTLTHLRRACSVTKGVARQGGIILFVGTRDGMEHVTIDAAKSCNAYYVASKWCPGTITNAQEIVGPHTPRLPGARPGELPKPYRPDLVIVLNPIENMIVIREATRFNIPTIAITDTDVDPRIVSYPIPGNDDSVRGVELVAKVLAEAAKEGNAFAVEAAKWQSRQMIEERVDRKRMGARQEE